MALLTILEFPDTRLRTIAKPVTVFDKKLQQLIDDMLETMYEAPGVGLAATQVNEHLRLIVMDISEDKNQPMVFINPQVVITDNEPESYDEGCLSVPGFYETVTRPKKVKITAKDRLGQNFTMENEGLLSICIQHEIDHLNGKLFVDYISPLKRNRIKRKLLKEQKNQDEK